MVKEEKPDAPWYLSVNMIGLVILVVAFSISVYRIASITRAQADPDLKTIRIAHWQLEAGYRDALQVVIEDYNKMMADQGKKVIVKQVPVTEKFYATWINTQFISGTAPDLSEMGQGKLTRESQNVSKYYMPLGDVINAPNKYNGPEFTKGLDPELANALAIMPWRDTFIDGLRSGWNNELKAYYSVPTSIFGIRLFYNNEALAHAKALMREEAATTGETTHAKWLATEEAPVTFGEFLWTCEYIRKLPSQEGIKRAASILRSQGVNEEWTSAKFVNTATLGAFSTEQVKQMSKALFDYYSEDQVKDYTMVAVTGSDWNISLFSANYSVMFTSYLSEKVDLNNDDKVDALETYTALKKGVISFESPGIKYYFEILLELTKQFGPGFIGKSRDNVVFDFVQGRAGCMATGSWEAGTLLTQTRFKVVVQDFPMPSKTDTRPKGKVDNWRPYMGFPPNEAGNTGGAKYGVNKNSPNTAEALDFLKFLTSYYGNQKFNQKANWIPVILGTSPNEEMVVFRPRLDGILNARGLNFHNKAGGIGERYTQVLPLYMDQDDDYATFSKELMDALDKEQHGLPALWVKSWKDTRNRLRSVDRSQAALQVRMMKLKEGETDEEAELSYKRGLLNQIRGNNGNNFPVKYQEVFNADLNEAK